MLLTIGLGNPGPQYAYHRHNLGFMALDDIAERHGFGPFRAKFQAQLSEGRVGGDKVLLLKPMTFMNESGRSVGQAMRFFKLTPADVLVIHDELDLEAGKCRVKRGGGAGGHNGLRSIDSHIGPDYWRVRVGVGHPGDKARVNRHLLNDFAAGDETWLDPMLEAVAAAFPLLAEGRPDQFMNQVAMATKPAAK